MKLGQLGRYMGQDKGWMTEESAFNPDEANAFLILSIEMNTVDR